ncbi:hypothetical protein HA402_014452 [Bradysia odoriphaga]|nr:hypothetical protein HA402_014452 [Bradysia odoriphaga]
MMTIITKQICLNILMIVSVIGMEIENYEKIIDQDDTSLAKALLTIISEFYVPQSNTISIMKGVTNRLDLKNVLILSDICAYIGKTLAVALQINEIGIHYQCCNVKFTNNIILVYSYESFRLTYDSMTAETFDYSGYYTIVITAEFNQMNAGIVKNILQDCWQRQITNVNVLVLQRRSERTVVTLYTYFPFTPFYCENVVVPLIWNYFYVDHFVHTKKELFPPKMKNLYQCPLTIVTVEIRPYIFLRGIIQSNNSITLVDGIDARLMYVLSQRMNFKPMFVIPDDIPRRGVIHKNGTVTGAFGMVYRRKANISTAANLYSAHRESILTATKPYMYEQLVFVVPNPIPYSPLEILLFPFTLSTWIAIVLIFAVAVVVVFIVMHNNEMYGLVVGLENRSPYMNLVCTLLVGPTQNEPKRNFARFLIIMWILACFVLRTAYQGQLFTFLKMDKMKDGVRSIEELIEKKITVKLPEELSAFVTFDQRMEKLLQFHHPNSYWNYVTETEAYVYPMSPLIYNVTQMIYTKGYYTKFKTLRIGIFPFVLYLPKQSCLRGEINQKIQSVVESGLIEKWTSDYKEIRFADSDLDIVPRKLNMTQLLGVFQLCGLILVVALISFILEIVSSINLNFSF